MNLLLNDEEDVLRLIEATKRKLEAMTVQHSKLAHGSNNVNASAGIQSLNNVINRLEDVEFVLEAYREHITDWAHDI